MKIGFFDLICDPHAPGASGLSDLVWNLAEQFAATGDEVHLVAPYAVQRTPHPAVALHRFELPPIGYRNILGHVLIVVRAFRALHRIPKLDVIHAPEYLSTGIIAPFTRVPVVLTTPGNIYERIAHGNPYDWSTTQVYKVAARSSARSCALIHAISNDMAWWWRRTGSRAEQTTVIPLGVDTQLFRRVASPVEARDRLGLAPHAALVVYVGRLSPEKRVHILLQALAPLLNSLADVHLAILGRGPQQTRLQALAERLGITRRVIFKGDVPKEVLPLWLSAAGAVVLPSGSEGLPRVMLEAMACGAPFIGTPVSGVRDHVQHGDNGYLVPVDDVGALTAQLRDVLDDSSAWKLVGARAAAYVREGLTWPAVTRRLRVAIRTRLPVRTTDAGDL